MRRSGFARNTKTVIHQRTVEAINENVSIKPNSYDRFYEQEKKRKAQLKEWQANATPEQHALANEKRSMANRHRYMKVTLPVVRCLQNEDD